MGKNMLAILCVAWWSIFVVNAQVVRISGIVTDSNQGSPISGVSVFVKGSTLGTVIIKQRLIKRATITITNTMTFFAFFESI